MSDIVKAQNPPFVFTYWNPFSSTSSLTTSWFDYVKDVSLAQYAADSVGVYIQQASADQVSAIDRTGRAICGELYAGFSALKGQLSLISRQLDHITTSLDRVNSRLGLLLDEAKLNNLLQENMGELLRIPDSQKQRQHHVEMGLKFLTNAARDPDLYKDALQQLLEAEKLMPSDYFVLHRIGMIYLYVPALGDIEKALDYFARAAKYAAVETDPKAARLSNILNKQVGKRFSEQTEPGVAEMGALAAESYIQAAAALYVLGRFEEAARMAEKAVTYAPDQPSHQFLLAKYVTRAGNPDAALAPLRKSVELSPEMALAAVIDFDLNTAGPVLSLLNQLDADMTSKVQESLSVLRSWPQAGSEYKQAHDLLAEGEAILKKSTFPEKARFAARVSVTGQLEELAAIGIPFETTLAQRLLLENNADAVRTLWAERREKSLVVNPELKSISGKADPSWLELVLLASAHESLFVGATLPGTLRWSSVDLGLGSEYLGPSFAMGASGQIYACCPELIGGGSGNLIAVDLPSGKVLWESKDLNLLCGVAPVKDDRVYATGEAGIYGISQETGKRLWEFRHDGLNYQPVIGAEGTVYAVSEKQGCYALDGQTGKQLWHFHDPRDPQGSEEEEEETSWGAFHYRPAAISADGTICLLKPTRRYKSDYDNRHDDGVWQNYTVYGLDGLTGQKLWEFASEPESEDYSVVYDGESYNILAVGLEGTLYIGMPWAVCALEGQSGRSLWQAKVQGEPLQQAAIGSDGAVYVACAGGNIRALDGRTGQKIWDIRLTPTDSDREGDIIFTGPAVGADGTIYVSAWDHMARPKVRVDAVYALSAQDGKKVWDCKLEGSVSELAIGSDGTLYFGAGGRLHALWTTSGREADSAWPMLGQNAQRTGLSGKAAAHYLANRSTITERNRLRAEECQRKCTEMGKLLAEAGAAEAAEKKKWLGKKDFSHARELYKKAAELGSDEAATKLKQLTA